jgi:protein-disulfide isomerase
VPSGAEAAAARRAREDAERRATERRRRLRLLGGVGAVVAVVVAVVLVVGPFRPDPAAGGESENVDGVGVRGARETTTLLRGLEQHGTVLGRPDAPATIIEIADLKCPVCQEHELRTQPEVIDRLVRTGRANLRMELVNYRDAAAGTTDGAAARRAAYALAPTDRFWPFVHAVFWNQGSEQDAWATDRLLRAVGTVLPGLGAGAVQTRETPAVRAGIAGADGLAKALGTTGTPSVYVVPRGGREGRAVDAGDIDAITRAVDAASSR